MLLLKKKSGNRNQENLMQKVTLPNLCIFLEKQRFYKEKYVFWNIYHKPYSSPVPVLWF